MIFNKITLFFVLFCGILFTGHAYDFNSDTNTNFTVGYDECTNTIDIKLLAVYDDRRDDYMNHVKIELQNADGSWSTFFALRRTYNHGYGTTIRRDIYGHEFYHGIHGNFNVNSLDEVHDGNKKFITLKLPVPQELMGQEVNIRIVDGKWIERNDTRNYDKVIDTITLSINNARPLPEVSGFVSTTDQCGKIQLTWEAPGSYAICGASSGRFKVNRGDTEIADLSYDQRSYLDGNRPHGEPTDYTITFYKNYSTGTRYSAPSSTTGSAMRRAYAPEDLTVTRNNCGEIVLDWQQRDENVVYSRVQVKWDNEWHYITYTDRNSFTVNKWNFNKYFKLATWEQIQDMDLEFRTAARFGCNPASYSYDSPYFSEDEKYSNVEIGKAVSNPSTPTGVRADIQSNSIQISWTPESTNEENFIIRRINTGDFSDVLEIELPAGTTSYVDDQIQTCVNYSYTVRAKNVCSDQTSDPIEVIFPSDLSSFLSASSLKASKGYHTNMVRLRWERNGNSSLIQNILVYRNEYGNSGDGQLIATLDAGETLYEDNSGESGKLYIYKVKGQATCVDSPIFSNIIQDIGFRVASGTITGNITFEGGNSVKDVRVIAEPENAEEDPSRCLSFNGAGNYGMLEDATANLFSSGRSTVELWAFSNNWNQNAHLYSSPQQKLRLTNTGTIVFSILTPGNQVKVASFETELEAGWHHFATVFDGNSQTLFIDGKKETSLENCPSGCSLLEGAGFYLGAQDSNADFFLGRMDEVRVWDSAKIDKYIEQSYSRKIPTNEEGLIAYWNMDEGLGGHSYDRSGINDQSFNENHLKLSSENIWSSLVPPQDKLSLAGITNDNGSYIIENVYFSGVGQTFSITPVFSIHQFGPASRNLFIGDNSIVHNGTDFTDESSFVVTGSIRYEGTNCAAEDIYIQVDGETVVNEGLPVITDENGLFSLSVPIGAHTISASKNGHTFSTGQWPSDGSLHDFQGAVSGIQFIDNTKVKIIGRVVGGDTESGKTHGFGYSKNNIGKAELTFTSIDNCYETTVTTNPISGEYLVELPPLSYVVDRNVPSNPPLDFGVLKQLNLTNNFPVQYMYADSVEENTEVDSLRVAYQVVHDYIHYSSLELIVSSPDTEDVTENNSFYIGEDTYDYVGANGEEQSVSLSNFPYQVFLQDKFYSAKIGIYERYTNYDNPQEIVNQVVGVKGATVKITNNLSDDTGQQVIEMSDQYDTLYQFRSGRPNLLENSAIPAYSFTKTFEVIAQKNDRNTSWEPLDLVQGGSRFFRGYLLGAKAEGSAFSTQGPEIVEHILRDPPGSGSSTSLAKGSSESISHSWNLGGSFGFELHKRIKLGTKFSAGLGVETPTDISNELGLALTLKASISAGGEYVETKETQQKWSTSSSPDFVGADADVFIGNSRNFDYGLAKFLELLPVEVCDNVEGVECFGSAINGYKLGLRSSLFLVPDGYATTFIYTQKHIEEEVIPTLEQFRNQLFFNNPGYTSRLEAGDEHYGSNNDDPVWGAQASTTNYPTSDAADQDGASYQFVPESPENSFDSVRYYNQQVRLWKEALARNEREKLQVRGEIPKDDGKRISAGDFLEKNLSISDGTSYDYTSTTTSEDKHYFSFELEVEEEIKLKIGAEVGGSGVEVEQSLKFSQSTGYKVGHTNSSNTSHSYHIEDKDNFNTLSIDVYKSLSPGNSPIFYRRGGKTSCPHEVEELTKYHEAGDHTISKGTISLDQPALSISPSTIVGIKADETATFSVMIGNESEITRNYNLQVTPDSNPFGAIIRINGLNPNQQFEVGPGEQAILQMTVDRGQTEYRYEDLTMVLMSECDGDVYMTSGVTVEFLPVCSEVSLLTPDNNFVVNTESDNKLDLTFGDYSLQDGDLDRIELQFRSLGSPDWTLKEVFYKDTVETEDVKALSDNLPYTVYTWELLDIVDGAYELRAVSRCVNGATFNSPVVRGVIDRARPRPFGTPSPGDGILSAGEDLMVRFNETIAGSLLSHFDIEVNGRLNEGESVVDASLSFDGIDDEMVIPDNSYLNGRGFTVEFWFKRLDNVNKKQIMISQGSSTDGFHIGLNESNQLMVEISNQKMVADMPVSDNLWHHLAFTLDEESLTGKLYLDSKPVQSKVLSSLYYDMGKMILGRSIYEEDAFSGNLADLRIWGSKKTEASIASDRYKLVSPLNPALLGHWLMDEGEGSIVKDRVKSRNGKAESATWQVSTTGWSATLAGKGGIEATSGDLAIGKNQGFSLEFWFKGDDQPNKTLFSNGKADGTDTYSTSWSIGTGDNGDLVVRNHGNTFTVPNSSSYMDNEWHHFALIMNRFIGMSVLMDGQTLETFPTAGLHGLAGPKFWIGSRGYFNGLNQSNDQYFTGSIDEVRLWGMTRSKEQVKRDKRYRMLGNETALLFYLPFDVYNKDAGVSVLNFTWQDIVNKRDAQTGVGVGSSQLVPLIKLPSPVQNVSFDYVVNNDELIIEINEPQSRIENVSMNILVKNVRDVYGNKIMEPVSWIAYIDQNQLTWKKSVITQEIAFESETNLTFTSALVNSGGTPFNYEIANIPEWLTVTPSSGTVAPNSEKEVSFSISKGLNVGNYMQNLGLTSLGSDMYDNLLLEAKVRAEAPEWEGFDPESFEYSMEAIAQVKYDGVLLEDSEVQVMALVDGEVRGFTYLKYEEGLDQYFAYLKVYSNEANETTPVQFKVWNPITTFYHLVDSPNDVVFSSGMTLGSPLEPVIFEVGGMIGQRIRLERGWNWISFNAQRDNLFQMVTSQLSKGNTIVKGQTGFTSYWASENRWSGVLSSEGLNTGEAYMAWSKNGQEFVYYGASMNPSDYPIDIKKGWNWIGVYGLNNLALDEGLASYSPEYGDVVKSINAFSVYGGDGIGWLGNLDYLEPGKGYLLKAKSTGNLVFPEKSSTSGRSGGRVDDSYSNNEFGENMGLIAQVNGVDGLENYVLEALVEEELRGVVPAIQIEEGRNPLFLLTVHGENADKVHFRLRNGSEVIPLVMNTKSSVAFQNNSLMGSLDGPMILSKQVSIGENEIAQAQVFPNPFQDFVQVSVSAAQGSYLKITLNGLNGKLIKELFDGEVIQEHTPFRFDGMDRLMPGIYILNITIDGESHAKKVIKR